jgi:hypothetical protein
LRGKPGVPRNESGGALVAPPESNTPTLSDAGISKRESVAAQSADLQDEDSSACAPVRGEHDESVFRKFATERGHAQRKADGS